jgi:hypothetical protein
MNERIRLFTEQATSYADTLDVADQRIYQEIRDREFAELIVKECNRYACSAWEHGPLLGRDLLIHFGIVELNDEQTY